HAPGRRGGYIQGRLFGFQGDQGRIDFHGIAFLDQNVDHGHIGKITDIRNLDFHVAHTLTGSGLEGSMPKVLMASVTVRTSTLPSSASAFSAATTMECASTSKNLRNWARESERP